MTRLPVPREAMEGGIGHLTNCESLSARHVVTSPVIIGRGSRCDSERMVVPSRSRLRFLELASLTDQFCYGFLYQILIRNIRLDAPVAKPFCSYGSNRPDEYTVQPMDESSTFESRFSYCEEVRDRNRACEENSGKPAESQAVQEIKDALQICRHS